MKENDIKIIKTMIQEIEFLVETLSIYMEGVEEEEDNGKI